MIWEIVRERDLKVGDQLPSIRELSGRLSIAPTAVRDALLKAETLGFVKVLPRAGAFLKAVVPLPLGDSKAFDQSMPASLQTMLSEGQQNVFHLLDARRLIEIELAGRAAERRQLEDLLPVHRALEAMLHLPPGVPRCEYVAHDVRFHVEIAKLSGNDVLFAVQRTFMELLRPKIIEIVVDLERRATTDGSHVAIYEALVAGNAERARAAMREHLNLAYDGMLRGIQEVPRVPR